nr:hypothetical protein [Tanacetum cinerariifolium]
MEWYLELTRGNQASGLVKPEIEGNVNYEIKSQFMRELREDTFFENKNDDAHEHVERVSDGWIDFLQKLSIPEISLKRPLSKGTVHHQRLLSNLKKSTTSSRNETRIYTKPGNGFSGNEKQETDNSGMAEALAALEVTLKIKKEEPKEEKQSVNYYVDPYEPQIPFLRRLEHHAEEALVHKTMESLKKIKINRPLLKEIRQTDNYSKYMKDLVENKPKTEEDEEIRMNPRMPIIPGRLLLATAYAKVDIFRKFISLKVGSEKVIFKMRSSFTTTFEFVRSIRSDTCLEDDDFKKIDYDLFLYDSKSYIKKEGCIGVRRFQKKKKMGANIGHLATQTMIVGMGKSKPNDWMKIRYGKVCKMTRERILKDHWRDRFGDKEDDLKENLKDPEECGEDKANATMGAIHDKLNDDWFNNTSKDEDDLEGILDYLEPRSYDGFIDLDDEAYNKRRCKLLGITYKEPTLILMEKVKVTRYTIGPGSLYKKMELEVSSTRLHVVSRFCLGVTTLVMP